MVGEGDPVPEVTMIGMDGQPLRSTDFKGHKLVLYFYPKDDTSGCTKEAQAFSEQAEAFQRQDAWVLGVSKDSPESHARFADKYDLKVKLATDPDGAVCEAFGTWVQKSMYGRKYMGIDRATFLIDRDGVVKRVWRKVKVPGHAQEVLEAVAELP